jgi:hypothetical protein
MLYKAIQLDNPVERVLKITTFSIVSLDDILNHKLIVNCRVFTDKGRDMGYNITLQLEGEDYIKWNNDEEYLLQKCKEKVFEDLPKWDF